MPVYMTALCEKTGRHIGHAFGYYDYGQKTGMTVAFSGKETSLDKGTQRKTTENELPSLTKCTA